MTLLWAGDFSALNNSLQAGFPQVHRQDVNGSLVLNGAVVPGVAIGGKNSLELKLNASGYRVEALPPDQFAYRGEGTDTYYRFDFYLGPDFKVATTNSFNCISQIHGEDSISPPIEFGVSENYLGVKGCNEQLNYTALNEGLVPVVLGRWYKVVFRVKASVTPANNLLEIWVDGTKVLSKVPTFGFIRSNGKPSYWKGATLYRSGDIGAETVYQTNHRIATDFDSVNSDPSTGGGTTTPPDTGGGGTTTPPSTGGGTTTPPTGTVSMPSDFLYAEVQVSKDAGFDTYEVVDRFTGAGKTVLSDLDYGTGYYVRLVGVDLSGNRSAPSVISGGTPEQVVNIDLGNDAVDSAKIKDLSVGRAKIADLAVNNAKIADLNVGKLTAGNLTATVITTDGSIRTSSDANNRITLDNQGLYSYQGGTATANLKFWLNANGNSMFSGTFKTAATGARIEMNPGGNAPNELRLYRFDADNYYAQMRLINNELQGPYSSNRPGTVVNIRSGGIGNKTEMLIAPDSAGFSYGDLANGVSQSRLFIDKGHSYISSPVVDISTDVRYPSYDGGISRIAFFTFDGTQATVDASTIIYKMINGFRGDPAWISTGRGAGVKFNGDFGGNVVCCDGGGNGFRKLFALDVHAVGTEGPNSGFLYGRLGSSRDLKHEIEPLNLPGDSVREAIADLVPRQYRWNATEPDGPVSPLQAGFIADEVARVPLSGASHDGLSPTAVMAMLRARQLEQDAELDQLREEINQLREQS